jgi:type VI secretion system protein ImpG
MKHRFLHHYEGELRFIRELGGEFARRYPKVAGRLGLNDSSSDDPHVERLLQGFAFTAGRVHMALDAEFPGLTQPLAERLYANYLAPTPSMAVVEFGVNARSSGLADGYTVPRGTVVASRAGRGTTSCEFRTAHVVELLPIALEEVTYTSVLRDIADLRIPTLRPIRALLKLTLRSRNMRFDRINLRTLPLFVAGRDEISTHLYEQLITSSSAVVMRWGPDHTRDVAFASETRPVRAHGFDATQALLPAPSHALDSYRLLQEYFACPARFSFVELHGLAQGVKRCPADRLELIVALTQFDPALEHAVDAERLRLFATPVINLFSRTCSRVAAPSSGREVQLVADQARPLDFEIHSVTSVAAHLDDSDDIIEVTPRHTMSEEHADAGLSYALRRRTSPLPASPSASGAIADYEASEVYLTLAEDGSQLARPQLRQLSVTALCTNRDLPRSLVLGRGGNDFELRSGIPADAVRCIVPPTAPRAAQPEGEAVWRLLNYLSLNYLSLSEQTGGLDALRDLLGLFARLGDPAIQRQIEGVRRLRSAPIIGPFPASGPRAFVRGLEVSLECEEQAFAGHGAFMLTTVLSHLFARHTSISSFVQVVLNTTERGEVYRWPAIPGLRHVL